MQVLYIHQYFSTLKGAMGTRSYEFAKELIARGHDVTMLCGSAQRSTTGLSQPFLNGKRQGLVDGIEVVEVDLAYSNYDSFPKRSIKFFKFVFKTMWFVLFSGDYDLVIATSPPLTIAISGILAKIIRRKPFILEIRDLWPDAAKEMGVITNPILLGAIGVLEHLAYRFADVGIGLAPGICKGMSRFGTLSKKQIALIPNGCDLEVFQAKHQEKDIEIPVVLADLLATKFTGVFCGAHGMANGLDAALDGAAMLKKKGMQNIALIFIGDGKMKPHLVKRAKDEQLDNCYFFDSMSKKILSTVLQQADVGMMLLRNIPVFYYGTSPNKFFDYIASGLPVLNNYPGWVADLIQDNRCGIVVPPGSPEAFADGLIKLVNLSKEQRECFSSNALKLAKEKFDRRILADKFVKVCEQVCEKDFSIS
jgi:glycosyltransferase involved in cell wall biosynthesis